MAIRPSSRRPEVGLAAESAGAIVLRRMLAFTRAISSRMEKGFVI